MCNPKTNFRFGPRGGHSAAAAMALAARHFLRGNVVALVQIASALSRDGFRGDEINIVLGRERVGLEAWRIKSLAELRRWLQRNGQSLN